MCFSDGCLLDPTPFSWFPLTSHSMCRRAPSHTDRALHRFVFGSVDSQKLWKPSAASTPLVEATTATLFALNRARRLRCSDFLQEFLTCNVFEPWLGHRLPYWRSSTSAGNARNMTTASFQLRTHSACCPICDVPYTKFVVRVKRPVREADDTPQSGVEIKDEWNYISERSGSVYSSTWRQSQKMTLVFRAWSITGVGWRMCKFISYKL
jgi:hypothetical protein